MSREDVLTHLRIMHTWATFALEKKQNFFTSNHMKNIAQWTEDALALLKEQEPKTGKWIPCKAPIYPYGYDVKCSECGLQMGSTFGYHYCPKCGARMEE